MKFKIIFITFFLFSLTLIFAADFKMCMEKGSTVRQFYTAEFDIVNDINPKINTVCKNAPVNIDELITRTITVRNMKIKTFCTQLPGQDKCGPGYSTSSSNLQFTSHIMNKNDYDSFVGITSLKTYGDYNEFKKYYDIDKILIREGGSNLFKVVGQTGINALGKYGTGCTGTYNYEIKRGSDSLRTFNGNLDEKISTSYTFNELGTYTISYRTTINNCFAVYREIYGGNYGTVHTFTDVIDKKIVSESKTLNIQVINSDGPTYTQPEGNVNCGLTYTGGIIFLPPRLVEGQSVIIPVYMTITNPFDVPIYINGVNHKYKIEKYIGMGSSIYLDTDDITSKIKKSNPCISKKVQINPIGQITCGPLEIKPKQKVTIKLDIESELVVDDPLEKYYLQVGFDYYYNKPSHGCYEAGSGTGSCPASINVDVIEEPEILKSYSLNANVEYEENIIDREFIENEKNTVNIFGRVNLTTNDGETPPVITTEWIGGAYVELVSLEIPGISLNCLEKTGLKTKTSIFSPPLNFLVGNYRFNNVELNGACLDCLEYGINDQLVAGIKVDYTTTDGVPLSSNFDGDIPIDTTLPTLACNINYKMAGSSYKPGEGTEEYNVTVLIENEIKLDKIIYTCGNEDDEETENLDENEFTFMCEYNFDAGNEDEIFIVQAQVWDEIGPRNTTCVVDIGLCYPYI